MKTFRLFPALLLALMFGLAARAQDSSEFLALRAKAEKGNAIAQYNLGLAYLAGTGTAASPIESFVWLSVARENGARGRALDNLVATMDRATHEAAMQRLAQFRATSGLFPAPPSRAATTTTAIAEQPAVPRGPDQGRPAAAPALPTVAAADGADASRLRLERDAAVAKLNELTGETTALRAERERLIARAAENSKLANDTRATNSVLQEQLQASNAKLAELVRSTESSAAELLRTQQALAALEKAPKPAPDTAALEAKDRELQAALTELEASRKFGREVENTLNKVTDQKQAQETALRVAQENFTRDSAALQAQLATATQGKAAAEQQLAELAALKTALEESRGKLAASEQQAAVLSTRIAELEKQAAPLTGSRAEADAARQQLTALQAELATATAETGRARQEAAALTAAQATVQQKLASTLKERTALEQEIAQLRAKPVAPAYPDLSGKVQELETHLAATNQQNTAALSAATTQVEKLKSELAATTAASAKALAAAKSATPAYPDLSGRVQALEAQIGTLQGALAAKSAAPAYPDLSGQVREMSAQAKDQQAAITRLTAELAAAQQEATAQAKARETAIAAAPSYPDLSGKVQALETQLAAATQQNSATLGAATAQVDQLKAELAAAKSAAPAYPNLAGKVQELETQLAAAKSASPAYPDLSGKVASLETQLAALQADRERMQKLLADTGKKLRDSADPARIKALETQATQAKSALANAESQVTSLITERDTLRLTLNEQRSANAALTQEKAQLDSALQAAQSAAPAYPNLTARVQELEAALAAKPGAPSYPDLSGQVRTLEGQLAAANELALHAAQAVTASRQQSAAELTAATAQIAELKAAQADFATAAARSQQEIAALTKAREEAQKSAPPAYPDLSGKVRDLETQLANAGQQNTAALSTATAQVDQLKAELAAAKSAAPAYPDLTGKVGELETALADASRQLVAANATQADTQQKLLAATAALPSAADPKATEESAAMRRERDELAGRVTSLTDEVTQLRTDRERMQKMLADAGRQMRDSTADASRIKELETQTAILAKARDEAQAQTASAQAALAAKSEAPAYPNLTDTVRALEGKVENLQAELAAKPAAPSYPDLTGRVTELETALAAAQGEAGQAKAQLATLSAVKPEGPAPVTAPAYPDLSGRVQELEAQVGGLQSALAAKTSAPAYPDLSRRVRELETALDDTTTRLAAEQARAATAQVASTTGVDVEKLQKQLTETEDKLATALRGYALLEKERDALAASGNKATEAVSAERNALSAQVATLTNEVSQLRAATTAQSEAMNQAAALAGEKQSLAQRLAETEARAAAAAADAARANQAVAALQRASAQNTNDLNATRALAQQLQGANSVLATENYQLKTMLSRTVTPAGPAAPTSAPVAAAPAVRTHVVASGDSLTRISQRYYGASNRWQEIYNANRDKIGNDGVLRVGTELRIP